VRARRFVLVLLLPLLVLACGGDDDAKDAAPASTIPGFESTVTTAPPDGVLSVRSEVFADGDPIPVEYTCDGGDRPVPLTWTGEPAGTAAIAVTVFDTDAQVEHLVKIGDVSSVHWFGPCPPEGDPPHHYVFTVYALDAADVPSTRADIEAHAIEQASITGLYERAAA
jgi:phosphatidylethanolamine-binding protein (PEBP) family uncharacterized protein